MLTLRWEYVDLERGLLRLPDSKTGPKVIPLNAPAFGLLADRGEARGDSPWVIPGAVAEERLVSLAKIWRRVRKRADLGDVRVHVLRRGGD